MPLSLVATPIGHPKDITLRAIECLEKSDFIICEEPKPARALLKSIGIAPQKEMFALNEHTPEDEVKELADKCENSHGALISDCGTPGFCDPGSRLVKACREQKIKMEVLPGASSLMMALSYSSQRIDHFLFVGFLPANKEKRSIALKELKKETRPLVILDTPYRLKRLVEDVQVLGGHRKALLCLDLSSEDEFIIDETLRKLPQEIPREKAEFVLIIYS